MLVEELGIAGYPVAVGDDGKLTVQMIHLGRDGQRNNIKIKH
jgi:hypothetical protein